MKLDDVNVLFEKINAADYVLVGIGEEWNITLEDVLTDDRSRAFYNKIERSKDLEYGSDFVLNYYNRNQNCDYLKDAYKQLLQLLGDKDYFVVSTTIDLNLKKYGFDEEKIVCPCGNIELMQCLSGCDNTLYKYEFLADQAMKYLEENEENLKCSHLKCPNCGKDLVFNNVFAEKYIEDGYLPNWSKYMSWLQKTINRKLVVLELGVGLQYPSVIRWPFEKTVMYNQKSSMFRIHHSLAMLSSDISDRSYSAMTDSVKLISTCKSDSVSL